MRDGFDEFQSFILMKKIESNEKSIKCIIKLQICIRNFLSKLRMKKDNTAELVP